MVASAPVDIAGRANRTPIVVIGARWMLVVVYTWSAGGNGIGRASTALWA
jgi:hypothetical protein